MLKFGDVLVTYGSFGLWPPRRWILWIVYNAIFAYQKKKWGAYSDYKPTHVRMYVGGNIWFESTTPVCRYITTEDLLFTKKKYKIVRLKEMNNLDKHMMRSTMDDLAGTPYDKGDLVDFFISGVLFNNFKDVITVLGDRAKEYTVCSTALATVLKNGGMIIDPKITDPSFFVNRPDLFELIEAQ